MAIGSWTVSSCMSRPISSSSFCLISSSISTSWFTSFRSIKLRWRDRSHIRRHCDELNGERDLGFHIVVDLNNEYVIADLLELEIVERQDLVRRYRSTRIATGDNLALHLE